MNFVCQNILDAFYGCEVYQYENRLHWYEDFPHPNDQALATTFPHHKHVPPNIKHNRIPAPNISFSRPNLSFLIEENEWLVESATNNNSEG